MNAKKLTAEAIGTFWLTFGGCGSAVIAAGFPHVGIGLLGVALAFGLTVVTMAYAIGHVSGCHLNPAVTVGLMCGGRFPPADVLPYIVAQSHRSDRWRSGSLCHRQWFAGLQSCRRICSQWLWRSFARKIRSSVLSDFRSGSDHGVSIRHHGRYSWQGTGRLCAACDRSRTDAHSSDQHSGDEHVGQPGA
jgi:hypothetical protein